MADIAATRTAGGPQAAPIRRPIRRDTRSRRGARSVISRYRRRRVKINRRDHRAALQPSNREIGDLPWSGGLRPLGKIYRARGTRFPCERKARSHSPWRHLSRILPIQGVPWEVARERKLQLGSSRGIGIARERRGKGMIMGFARAAPVALLAAGGAACAVALSIDGSSRRRARKGARSQRARSSGAFGCSKDH
jgi:hypothetical protein